MKDSHITRCPFCQTSFKVTDEHLSIANGSVRCGSCLRVFMAELYFLDSQGKSLNTPSQVLDFESRKDSRQSREQRRRNVLQKVQEQLNEKQRDKRDKNEGNFRPLDKSTRIKSSEKSVQQPKKERLALKTASETKDEELPTSDEILDELVVDDEGHWDEKIPSLPVSDLNSVLNWDETDVVLNKEGKNYIQRVIDVDHYERFRQEITKRFSRQEHTALWFFLSLVLSATLFTQYIWFQRDVLSQNPNFRSAYERSCLYLDCDLPDYVNLSELLATDLVIRPHSEKKSALTVNALLRNESKFQQPFPDLDLQFTSIKGNLIVHRQFTPSEYLKGELNGLKYIPPRTEVRLGLEIMDPGEDAVNYSLQLVSN